MKYIITENQYNNAIDKFITYQLEPHEEKRTKKYPKSVFWVKDGAVIAEIIQSKYFYVNYKIWKSISNMLSLEYSETQQVITDWLEEHYKLGGLTPLVSHSHYKRVFEEHYKLK
jgi:uncharacterized membrane protein